MTDPYGMIDLASLRKDSGSGGPSGTPGRYEVSVTEQDLQDVIAQSSQVATLLVVTSSRVPDGAAFLDELRRAVDAQSGLLRLATVDADTQARVAQALQVRSIPTVLLLVRGQVQPLFEGVIPSSELDPLVAQVVQLAQQQGMTGLAESTEQPEAEELSPLEQEAFDAIEAGDLDRAEQAYSSILADSPGDAAASAGVATVHLMQRTGDADLNAARAAAADDPADLDAQLLVADLDVLGGHVDDAFARLLTAMRGSDTETRDRVRTRLLELFDVVGHDDPRVAPARRKMANLLF